MTNKLSRRSFIKGLAAGAAGIAGAGLFTVCTGSEAKAADDTKSSESLGEATLSYEAEVAVVGAGAAGLMAALELARAGKKVLVLEAGANAWTSNFSMCGGPAACETKLQEQEGEDLPLDKLFKYMYSFSRTSVNGTLLKKALAGTSRAINNMMELEIPMSLWPDVYDNGFRARHYFECDGKDRIEPIVNAIEAAGGEFVYGVKVTEPVMENGVVVGVKGQKGKDVVEVRAKASLIATGGFLGNTEMQIEHFNTPVFPLGNTVSDGSGIELVHKAGGVDDRSFAVLGNECGAVSKATKGWPFTPEWFNKNEHYGYWLFGGLYVDHNGERFINEEDIARLPLAIGGEALVRQGKAYVIMDSEYYEGVKANGIYAHLGEPAEWVAGEEADYYITTPENADAHLEEAISEGWAVKADSIEDLAEAFGLSSLAETVEKYNSFCDKGEDSEFYKSKTFLSPVKTAPFYAFEYVPSAWGTNGGIKVDACLHALNNENNAIPGLFVAGVDTGSMYTVPYYDNPGSSVGLAIGSGIVAADEIAKFLS